MKGMARIPTRFLFTIVFAGLGGILLWKSLTSEHLAGTLIFAWFSLDLLLVSLAYLRRNHRVFGKTDDGTMRSLHTIVMAPFLCFTWLVWQLQNLFSKEPVWNEVMHGRFVGRRCSFDCLPPNATTVIDLTAEFPTPAEIRRHTRLVCIPTLDGCSPNQADCLRLFDLVVPVKRQAELVYFPSPFQMSKLRWNRTPAFSAAFSICSISSRSPATSSAVGMRS